MTNAIAALTSIAARTRLDCLPDISIEALNRIFTGFAGPDSDDCFYGGHKYFAVTDASSSGCLADGFNRKVYSIIAPIKPINAAEAPTEGAGLQTALT